jgi:uracil-DNA glycosylase
MLVRFLSSETGELLMFADAAGDLLRIVGKSTTARGGFVQDEMRAAADALRAAVKRGEQPPTPEDDDESIRFLDKPVAMSQRAWPFIDMLERSSKGGAKANIVWQAAADF